MIKTFNRIVCAMAVMASYGWASIDVREAFTATDGNTYYLRAATSDDIDNHAEKFGFSESTIAERKSRIENGYFGVFLIETEAGDYVNKLFTGRMPLGVQPWPSEDQATTDRLSIVIDFYGALLEQCDLPINHVNVVRDASPETPVMLINNSVHAATAVIPAEPFNTTALLDALVMLANRLNYQVAPDANISTAGVPTLIISTSKETPILSENSRSKIFHMPYFPGADGMRYTTVTRFDGFLVDVLPETLSAKLGTYTSHFN